MVPPMVAKAREELAKQENDRQWQPSLLPVPLSSLSGSTETEMATTAADAQGVVLETFKRRRKGAPLEPVHPGGRCC